MAGNGIDDYGGKMAVDLEDEEAERQAEAAEEPERNDGKINVNLEDDGQNVRLKRWKKNRNGI